MGRRVFAFKLQRPPQIDDAISIEPQRFNCGAACRSQTEQRQTVFTPGEVLVPQIFAWMKEGNQFPADRIDRVSLVVLGIVATLAGQREVFSNGFAAKVFGDSVILGMLLRSVRIGADTVFAMTPRALSDQLSQLLGRTLFRLLSHGEWA